MPEISTTITENKKNIIIKTKKNNIWMFKIKQRNDNRKKYFCKK